MTCPARPWSCVPFALIGIFILMGAACGSRKAGEGPPPEPSPVTYDYEVPVSPTSPWPQMRRTRYNNGRSPVLPVGDGTPWSFRTGKGIFSTPVIGHDGTVLIGSADRNFYAIRTDGTEKWRFPTGEIIDSAAAVAADGTIYVPSADGHVYALAPDGREIWRYRARHSETDPAAREGTTCGPFPPAGGPSNWFEGNVIIGEEGRLWAGNDNYRMYGLSPGGQEEVVFFTSVLFGAVWSAAATLPDGSAIFGSMDMNVYAVTAEGGCRWKTGLGFLISSTPALSDDMTTAYIGSWDGNLYALDTTDGAVRWKTPTRDHVYASPAIAADGTVYIGSADGSLYAFSPAGEILWTFDTLDPIRSSPAVAGDGTVIFGAGDGTVYALNPDGTRRWSYDTTDQDRNDLNASPALGADRVYIGGENGLVHGIPYSYCAENPSDPRCSLSPAGDLPEDGVELYWVTPGGRSFAQPPGAYPVMRGAVLAVRLLVRRQGETRTAGFVPRTVSARLTPEVPVAIVPQAGGRWLNLVPAGMLAADTPYELAVGGDYETSDGERGTVSRTFAFRTVTEDRLPPALEPGADTAFALEIKNLAPYQPPLVVSLNQIGFDSVDMIGSVIHRHGNRFVLWLTAGRQEGGRTVIDPETLSMVPLDGVLDGASFVLEGGTLDLVTGGPLITVARFRTASQFDTTGAFDTGTSAFTVSGCLDMGLLGVGLLLFGQCNAELNFITVGTMRGFPYDGEANRRPAGVTVTGVSFSPRQVTATFDAAGYPLAEHLPAIVLVNEATGAVVPLNYGKSLRAEADAATGNLSRVTLAVPASAGIRQGETRAIVLADLFPVASVLWE